MPNKISISKHCIEIKCNRGDADTLEKLSNFYPVHANRTQSLFKVSLHSIPEVLQTFRGITEENIGILPSFVQNDFYNEMRARKVLDTLLTTGPTESPVVTPTLTTETPTGWQRDC